MKKCFNKIMLCLSILGIGSSLASCTSFFGNSASTISDITSKIDENGNTILTVSFNEESISPIEVTIPRGNGIDHIEHSINNETSLDLTIYYTDSNKEPTKISLPIIKGNDGLGVANVQCVPQDNGDYELTFVMTDGSKYGPFTIFKGKDGKNIVNVEATTNQETGYTTVTIYYDDETSNSFDIELGKDGKGIKNIEVGEDIGNNYVLIFTYTDGSKQEVQLTKPQATRWYTGNGTPENNVGSVGDFYIDNNSKTFYTKTSSGWMTIFSLEEEKKESFTITFITNGGNWVWTSEESLATDNRSIIFEEGTYVELDQVQLQINREGYTFNGWWTDAEINSNSGHFTELTPVFDNLTLYANWIEN